MRQKRQFVIKQVASLGPSPKKNINETEIPLHQTTILFVAALFFLWYRKNMGRVLPI